VKTLGLLLLGLVACVPATEEKHARGAAGFVTEPSPAARGEPFQTTDGWSVRVERIAFLVSVSTRAITGNPYDYGYGGGGGTFLVNGAIAADVYSPGLPPGMYEVNAYLTNMSIYGDSIHVDWDNIGVEPSIARRFEVILEETRDEYGNRRVPSAIVIARGTKLDRTIVLDVALWPQSGTGSGYSSPGTGPSVEVRQNAVALRALDVRAEVLFFEGFDEIAEADARGNNDGRATMDELANVMSSCVTCGTDSAVPSVTHPKAPISVMRALRVRVTQLLREH
jgi:hypothetical protein